MSVPAGELEYRGVVSESFVWLAPHALAAGDSITKRFPHVLRLDPDAWDLEDEGAGGGISATLYWTDDHGKWWTRVGAQRARRVHGKAKIPDRAYP